MPSTTRSFLHRIVERLGEMAADADYAQRRLFEIRTGIDLSQGRGGRPYPETPISVRRTSGDGAPSHSRSGSSAPASSRTRTTTA